MTPPKDRAVRLLIFFLCIELGCLIALAHELEPAVTDEGIRIRQAKPQGPTSSLSFFPLGFEFDGRQTWQRTMASPRNTLMRLLLACFSNAWVPGVVHRRSDLVKKPIGVQSRSCPLSLLAKSPEPDMDVNSVVKAQLSALSQNDIETCFAFASPTNKQATGPLVRFEKLLRENPTYAPLVGCSSFEILSTLTISPGHCYCRVRIRSRGLFSPPDGPEGSFVYRWELRKQAETSAFKFNLGQAFTHKKYDYKAVILGYDPYCKMPQEWIERMSVDSLPNGRGQPFYHALVDVRDRPGGRGPDVTYVAEENIQPFQLSDTDTIEHPNLGDLFEGSTDGRYIFDGRYIPIEALRGQLSVQYPSTLGGCWLTDSVVPENE